MFKTTRREFQRRRPAISPTGSWLLAGSGALLLVSLMLPWFEGRISFSYVQYYGFQLGLVSFCTAVLAAIVGVGVWCSWVRRASFVVLVSLGASTLAALFAGFAVALSSTLTRLTTVAGLGEFVSVRARPGLVVLLIGGLLGIAGSTLVLARWVFGARSSTTQIRLRKRRSSRRDSTEEESWFEEDDEFEYIQSGAPASYSSIYDDEDW